MERVKLDIEQFRALVEEATTEELIDLEEELVLALGATEDAVRALNARIAIADSAVEVGVLTPESAHDEKAELLNQMTKALAAKNWYRQKLSLVRKALRSRLA